MNKLFSILITTRQRVWFLNNLLKSIYDSTIQKENVEILIIYDNDDNDTISFIKDFSITPPPIKTHFYGRERSKYLVNDYHNWLIKFAEGKYIIFSNDDALFEMYGWDDRAQNKLKEYEISNPDGIVYGLIEDFENEPKRRKHNWMACFPLISKKAIDVLGYAFDPEFVRDGADWAIAATYYSINRVVDLRDCIIIRHLSFRAHRRAWDSLDEYAKRLGIVSPPANSFINRNKEKLLEYINNYIKEHEK